MLEQIGCVKITTFCKEDNTLLMIINKITRDFPFQAVIYP